MLTSPSGRKYIGKTINLESRMENYKHLNCKGQRLLYNSLKKYGFENHKLTILYQGDLEEAILYKLEEKFIAYYDTYRNGLNLTTGGDGVRNYVLTDEDRKKLSTHNPMRNPINIEKMKKAINTKDCLSKRSASLKKRYAEKGHPLCKRVHKLTMEGVFVKEYPSTMEASRQEKTKDTRISDCCNGKRKTHRGFRWIYV